MTPEFLRPKDAAARFSVSRQTLAIWARDGRIGRSEIEGCVWYRVSDIAELIASHETRRRVVPTAPPVAAPVADDPGLEAFWAGTAYAPARSPTAEPTWVTDFWADTAPTGRTTGAEKGKAT